MVIELITDPPATPGTQKRVRACTLEIAWKPAELTFEVDTNPKSAKDSGSWLATKIGGI